MACCFDCSICPDEPACLLPCSVQMFFFAFYKARAMEECEVEVKKKFGVMLIRVQRSESISLEAELGLLVCLSRISPPIWPPLSQTSGLLVACAIVFFILPAISMWYSY